MEQQPNPIEPLAEFSPELAEFLELVFAQLPARAQQHKIAVGERLVDHFLEFRAIITSSVSREPLGLVADSVPVPDARLRPVLKAALIDAARIWAPPQLHPRPRSFPIIQLPRIQTLQVRLSHDLV
jgi:hypothetical protein